jgi:membrane-bound metal-dependent hydrolase YbcI (DUF457 family)
MFIGHFAVGLALKRAVPRTSLGILVAAPQLLDLLWPWFLLLGWEHVRIEPGNTAFTPLAFDSYPLSHSLLMAVVWAVVFVLLTRRMSSRDASLWIGLAVISHWLLDWITHGPDLPLLPLVRLKVGLGLWNSVAGTVVVETAMFAVATWLYATGTRPRDGVGRWAFVTWIGVLVVIYVGNIFSPPPPDVRSLSLVALLLWLFPVWAWWFDGHRSLAAEPAPTRV